jgi:hypothetical protein
MNTLWLRWINWGSFDANLLAKILDTNFPKAMYQGDEFVVLDDGSL